MPARTIDIAVIGAGAAGLMAGISAARAAPGAKVVILDGARTLGAKILVAGGGRCNVTHHAVDESAYAGSSRNAIKNVLRAFPVERTIAFFADLGVELKREPTGKLFPTTDSARTVLDALLAAARDAGGSGADVIHPWRVDTITREPDGTFLITRAPDVASDPQSPMPGPQCLSSRRVILATGGLSLPKSGSDGHGHALARRLGHSITPRVFPALVPLTLPKSHWVCAFSGLTVPATLELRAPTGKRLVSFTNSTLCTHFGLSGPSVLDISRYVTDALRTDPAHHLVINWLAGITPEALDAALLGVGGGRGPSIARWLSESAPHGASVVDHADTGMPDRLARALCDSCSPLLDPATPVHALTKLQRRAIVAAATATPLPVSGDRGYLFAEVTAGGVPLSELHLATMESRVCPGLHLCGELCDVDGRIGGFNFQWAWASGHAAGKGAATAPASQY
jgi:hypothetical protein